jgi:glycosyltransferase involved in cell wall biosynthesis
MSVHSKLQGFSVNFVSDQSEFLFRVRVPNSSSLPERPANPLVSCLMVTRGDIELLKHSFTCYQRQTYANRELVIVVEPDAGEKVRAFIASQDFPNVRLWVAPPGLTLGDHRNLVVARASGELLATWDDDDLSDPRRLEITVQVLRQTDTAAAILSRLLLWWPQRKLAAISERRTWEQSTVAWRNELPIYPSRPRDEDVMTRVLLSTHKWAAIDCPFLYVYVVTGRNTWGVAHFEEIFSRADCCFEGDQFDELTRLLSSRLPLLDYAAVLNEKYRAAM